MPNYITKGEALTAMADSIRAKRGTSAPITFDEDEGFSDEIDAIETGITPSGTKQINANGSGIDVTEYAAVDVAVPNSYTSNDAGKVVAESGGSYALAAQTSRTVTDNGTYDTTGNNSVTVNIPAASGVNF